MVPLRSYEAVALNRHGQHGCLLERVKHTGGVRVAKFSIEPVRVCVILEANAEHPALQAIVSASFY